MFVLTNIVGHGIQDNINKKSLRQRLPQSRQYSKSLNSRNSLIKAPRKILDPDGDLQFPHKKVVPCFISYLSSTFHELTITVTS